MTDAHKWRPCTSPQVGNILKWNEPLWAAPNKPRGKRDKIGEQEITAKLISSSDVLEFEVISVKKISSDQVPLSVQESDNIRRKHSSIEKGNCHKLA